MFTCCSLNEGGTQLSACGLADAYHSVVTFAVGLTALTEIPRFCSSKFPTLGRSAA